jgi:hypothetical protein
MKPLSDKVVDQLEDVAIEGAKQLKAFFVYQGDNPRFFQKAKLGAVAISGYARIRQSETGRMAIELAARRQTETLPKI